MFKLKTISDYSSRLTLRQTEKAIKTVKDNFERIFSAEFGLERISAPMFVLSDNGINDDLSGVERPVVFDIKELERTVEIVHSLAKWKRVALHNYGFAVGEGLYTDMNAIRRDDIIDNIHSVYVDQWDWEMVITRKQRSIDFLKSVVCRIVGAIAQTLDVVKSEFPQITTEICRNVFFVSSQELLDMYPDLDAKERENKITALHKTVFVTQIGGALSDGKPHDGRAPDYDDWTLNGDLLIFNAISGEALEISSMGIRVDANALKSQLSADGKIDRLKFAYHKGIINDALPLTIGGGIGQSRLCMLLLQKLHIGEVQVSIWPDDMLKACSAAGIKIL